MTDLPHLDMLEADIRNINMMNTQSMQRNARAHIQNTFMLINADADCRAAGNKAIAIFDELAHEAAVLTVEESHKQKLDQLTAEALAAVVALKMECERCGPNDVARALGV